MDKEFEIRKKELLNPFYIESGAALMDCQTFEYGISLLLYIFSRIGVMGLDLKDMTAIMENETKKTAGQLINTLKKYVKVSDNFEDKLNVALDARNVIIHRVIIDNIEKLQNPETRNVLIKEINTLRSKVRLADKLIRKIVNKLLKELDGFDAEEFLNEIKHNFN